ncbi:hypothetical protein NKJ68_25295 [Mesorhizobium sp. M0053]|uniref:hypothetical protein n=1 Tax=Mesorhizobium sp. LNJC380A00 TaxID=1287264 RepID=UPI001FDA7D41|nr:hypothetical protein [Mesorhizobium sp. LNJC380A00]
MQTIATEPFLHVQMDAFIDMLPPALYWKRARPRAPTGCPAWRAGNMDASTTA